MVAIALLLSVAVVLAVEGFVAPNGYIDGEPDYADGWSYVVIAVLCSLPFSVGWLALRRLHRLLRSGP